MKGLELYILLMFVLGAMHSLRMGLVFAFLSAAGGSVALLAFHADWWQLLLTQVGVFVGGCALWLLLGAMLSQTQRIDPSRASATYRYADASLSTSESSPAKRLLAAFVFIAVLVAPFAILAIYIGPVLLSGDALKFLMITGVIGLAILLMVVLPILAPAFSLALWARRRILREDDKP